MSDEPKLWTRQQMLEQHLREIRQREQRARDHLKDKTDGD